MEEDAFQEPARAGATLDRYAPSRRFAKLRCFIARVGLAPDGELAEAKDVPRRLPESHKEFEREAMLGFACFAAGRRKTMRLIFQQC